jgi:hypothetical protein
MCGMAGVEDSLLIGAAVALALVGVAATVWARRRRPAGGFVPVLALLNSALLLALVLVAGGGAWIAVAAAALCAATAGITLLARGRARAATIGYVALVGLAVVATWGTASGRLAFPVPGADAGMPIDGASMLTADASATDAR